MSTNSPLQQQFIDAQFKDKSPAATVAYIKGVLSSLGIEVKEHWHDSSVPHCYALSANVVGTTFYVNGKGLSKEFALASCYGELMERLQLGFIYKGNIQKQGTHSYDYSEYGSVHYRQFLNDYPRWFELLSSRLRKYTGISKTPEEILAQFADRNGNLTVCPYFCLTTGEKVYYPNAIRGRIYTSNGCAAGNTPEETIVQAISEIVERHHMVHITDGGVRLPDIPEEVLKQYQTAYSIITYIRQQGYRVTVKDCSLGEKFPVVCVYIIDEQTGRYHTHFGAYPIFEIALERSLTESFQGRTIRNITRFEDFLYKKPGEMSFSSISNEVVRGAHEKTTSFFLGQPQYAYNANAGFEGGNNKALLRECVDYFKQQGYDILIRDRSCLGLCTYQVIIPGYSEVFLHRLDGKIDENRYAAQAQKVLRNPSAAALPELLAMLLHMDEMKKYPSNIASMHGFLSNSKISAEASPRLDHFLMSATMGYAYYALGKYPQALSCVAAMLNSCEARDTEFLICLKRYLSLKLNKYDAAQIQELLQYFHRSETVERLYNCLQNNVNPLEPFTLHCDEKNCDGCRLRPYCCQKRVLELADLVHLKSLDLDFEKFAQQLRELV